MALYVFSTAIASSGRWRSAMAESKRVRKQSYKRNVKKEKPLDPLLKKCLEFVEHNSSLALDDSYDRQRLAEEMVEFIMTLSEDEVSGVTIDDILGL